MKWFRNISIIIISIWALPKIGLSQCMSLSEPLFLQAPDSLCAETKDLIIKASRVKETNARYFWRTPLSDTITTDSILRIAQPTLRHSGDYFVAIMVDTCRTTLFGPINVQIIGAQKTLADTVKTVLSCNSSEIAVTSTFKTSSTITGKWLGTEGVVFDKPNTPSTVVKGLKEGENLVVWVLSSSVCRQFVKDSFIIRREVAPQLQADGTSMQIGESSTTIHLGHVAGSNINLIDDIAINITKPPKNGSLEILSDGKRLKYNRGSNFQGRDAFELKVCNQKCLNLCSPPVPYTIDVFFDEHYPNVTIHKILAPKDLGEAKVFRIEKVEDYPENELLILNRWGNTLLKLTNYKNQTAWDGLKDGVLLPSGAYYYLFQAKAPNGKALKPLSSIFYIIY